MTSVIEIWETGALGVNQISNDATKTILLIKQKVEGVSIS